ncbi:hypothetical protein [Enterococcus rivorum]|uniref:Maltodextrose utilization protein MalA n=1 Tax=Enterococcus rivorum TaxID=762845 RepID=A0A1E5KSJ8_9ENTE|nr:hypothetical protein [Enterococcus rivorum]MBP2098241.1 maltodextrin utilization protein YvdJ [Enterococcus rivorum]OEH80840.1 hypothetical protein BCR26_06305 [Enterococcus rivorum]
MNIVTPKRVFKGRKALSRFQIGLIFIFISSIMLIPVTINLARSTNFQLADIMPETFEQLDQEGLTNIQQADFQNGYLKKAKTGMINQAGTVGFHLDEAELADIKNGISFGETSMLIKAETGYNFKVQYSKDFNPSSFQTVDELKQGISSQWLTQNRAFVVFTMIAMSGSLILVSHVILVFGGAFFIWLTKKNQFSSIQTYQESLNLILNGLGLSTFLGMLVGLIHFDMSLVLSIQSLGLVLMLLGVFVKTRFNDSYSQNKRSKYQKV